MTSIPPFPFPKRKYVFEVETQDDQNRVWISAEAYWKKEGVWDDQGSESDDKYIDGFYDWMHAVCESMGDEVDEVCESIWAAGGCCGSDDTAQVNADMQKFIDFLRGHPNFVEVGKKVKKAKASAAPPVSEQAPTPDQDAVRQLRQKMEGEFIREGRSAEFTFMCFADVISRYKALQFEKDFFVKHPEYASLKDDNLMWVPSRKADRYAALYANPEFVAHLEALTKLCNDFDRACNTLVD
jgi:hypothetical protein